ncbi:MAG: hypothetical protein KDA55_12725 [Planctomycetales bacterium]|nr:hypothetical protein [Planctomycetales bacterium]MCA9228980.1 hypothetical protein [Planctomycetales bacterium]
MSIQNERQLRNTRTKLADLEAEYRRISEAAESKPNAQTTELTLRSLGTVMKQLKEEIAQYETRRVNRTG